MSEVVIILTGLGTCIATVYLALFANRQIADQRLHHKQEATVELLISNNNNAFYREQRKEFLEMRRQGENFTALACRVNEKGGDHEGKNSTVLAVLNSIEFICVGIKEGIFDEAVYKRMSRSSVINDWHTLKPYIMELRRINGNNPKLFCEFEWLAEKWLKDTE